MMKKNWKILKIYHEKKYFMEIKIYKEKLN